MNNNYQRMMENEISSILERGAVPKLLLHSCCAPCSSYCIEQLSNYFSIDILYFNPNIEPEEYKRRLDEQKRFAAEFPAKHKVSVIEGRYDPLEFRKAVAGHENDKEGGARCAICYHLRLQETAAIASREKYDYFTTTLTISPLKNAEVINQIGAKLEQEYNVKYLFSDFKKKNGYLRSTELSKEYSLYRQNYCGCVYSKPEFKI